MSYAASDFSPALVLRTALVYARKSAEKWAHLSVAPLGAFDLAHPLHLLAAGHLGEHPGQSVNRGAPRRKGQL